jgi:hypothetical protein
MDHERRPPRLAAVECQANVRVVVNLSSLMVEGVLVDRSAIQLPAESGVREVSSEDPPLSELERVQALEITRTQAWPRWTFTQRS